MKDEKSLSVPHGIIDQYTQDKLVYVVDRVVNQVQHKKRTNREFQVNAHVGDYDMDHIILDLGSDVNVLPRQTWEMMGKPKPVWSPIQLTLENQKRIIPIGRFPRVSVNIDGVSSIKYFEVIEIVDDSK